MRLRAALGAIAILLSGVAATAAVADPLWNTPVYNPETRSYFELYTPAKPEQIMDGGHVTGLTWLTASELATKRTYKGVRGRLAVVKTLQTHEFLRETFQPNVAVWIGLRYWCKYGKLQWVTGEIHPVSAFAKWGRVWNQGTTRAEIIQSEPTYCPKIVADWHLGVHYWPVENGFVWNANGRDKNFGALFIEYPTGKE